MKLWPLVLIALVLLGCGDKSKSDQERIAERTPQTTAPAIPDTITPAPEEIAKQPPTEPKEAPKSTAPPVNPLINKRWKLIELLGEPVVVTEGFAGDPYVTFALRNSKLTGSGGCNRSAASIRLMAKRSS
jgi:heat shock protein HslJ